MKHEMTLDRKDQTQMATVSSQVDELQTDAAVAPKSPVRVLVADDHEIVLQGLKKVLQESGVSIVAEATNGLEAVRLTRKLSPDVVVLDIGMPLMNGIDAAAEITKSVPDVKTVLLTVHNEDRYVLEALRAGVRGYVLKSRMATEVIQAIRDVCEGSFFLSPNISRAIVDAYLHTAGPGFDNLTPREVQVLRLVVDGKTTREIANLLGITMKTADTHRTNLMHKLDIHSSTELVHYAIRRGLVQS